MVKQQVINSEGWFTTVEIEVNSRCNRSCSYCPVSILPKPAVPKFMDIALFKRIIDELAMLRFCGRLSYHFYNEPLLRKDIGEFIHYTKQNLPGAFQVLYTNGDLLTDSKYDELIKNGIDLIYITSHSLKEFPARANQKVHFPHELKLTNRGGILEHIPVTDPEVLDRPCYAPSEMLIITTNGDIVLCYEDAKRQYSMGNVTATSIADIWLSENFFTIRNNLKGQGGRYLLDICKKCSNVAHTEEGFSHVAEP